ncbi:Translin [Exidia glandulosa HHB12029]|uniref:Translin n=1 Tax=Exidia glandulosa HHB12029 TaxID=1314781 RepID=A0A165PEJ3_EXIGL|nr:Translin [Exidia glandulosa HHB12029]
MNILTAFETFRDELDDQQEKRERLIKTSREVTATAKKIIFLLHRLVSAENADSQGLHANAIKPAKKKLGELNTLFAKMAPELKGEEFWRHWRSVSPGLQEYIEALSFAHYLEFGTLASYHDVQAALTDADGVPYFNIPLSDYLLGISDLTGELMRYAIVAISRADGTLQARQVLDFVRGTYADLEKFSPHVRELPRKQDVTSASLQKIEDAVYAVVVRGAEYRGQRDDIADEIVRRYVAGLDSALSRGSRGPRDAGADDDDGDD